MAKAKKNKTKAKSTSKSKAKMKSKPKAKSKVKVKAKPKVKAKVKAKIASKVKPKVSQPQKKAPKQATTNNIEKLLTPLDDRIVVQLSGVERKTAGGLIIPDTVADVSGNLKGKVVAVGRGHLNKKGKIKPMDVKLGDEVVFSEFSGNKIKLGQSDFVILREVDVLGTVSK